jgi:hypothetical protein
VVRKYQADKQSPPREIGDGETHSLTVEQLGIDDVANTYLPPQTYVAKRVRRSRNIGAGVGSVPS